MPSSDPRLLTLTFRGDTTDLVRAGLDEGDSLRYPLTRRASIKDIIEALGVPHTEVGRLLCDGVERDFRYLPEHRQHIVVYPQTPDLPPTVPTPLRPCPLPRLQFLVDINIGKLGRLLRLAGLDAEPADVAGDSRTAHRAAEQQRILLSKSRDILKHKVVRFGRLIRSEEPHQQFREIFRLYSLKQHIAPFSRCLECNDKLEPVAREKIIDRLEPLTKKYYSDFKQCPSCARIYWRGSHHRRMVQQVQRLQR